MAVNIPIWPGSGSAVSGSTPFGFYDDDLSFQRDAPKAAKWCAYRLGYPLTEVELQDINFYAAFEEAITEYSNQVNTHSARDNILSLMGVSTGSVQLQQQYVPPSSQGIISIADDYGTQVGVGGKVTYYSGSLSAVAGTQQYDLTDPTKVSLEVGTPGVDSITIRKIYHDIPPAIVKYFDPFIGTGLGTQNLLEQFGFGNYSPGVNFMLMPIYYDVMRVQAIEFNDQIRKSSYSFSIINNRLKLFPIPTKDYNVWFEYTLDAESGNGVVDGSGKISDHSNIPYYNMTYGKINDIGKQWIRKYMLAVSKEMLGYIRGKYESLPSIEEGANIMLNSDDLIASAQLEKQDLIGELRHTLDQFSRQAQLERRRDETEALKESFTQYPMKIYIF